ncbi:MAG: hypothetical protein GKR94_33120 [Gammaproteobacteria bacterium]|nr:hypothetical protein [Gammaproteobacteria bacterium]
MRLADVEWRLLRGSMMVSAICLTLGGALIYGAAQIAAEAERRYMADRGRYQSARARYLRLDDEKRLLDEFAPKFALFREHGLIGTEQRLSWVEALRAVAVGLKLAALQYEIGTQEAFSPEFTVPAGSFKVFSTDMQLKMGLLHEGDLRALLTALEEAARGQFSVTNCRFDRSPGSFDDTTVASRANLEVRCNLRWLLVKNRVRRDETRYDDKQGDDRRGDDR